MASLFTGCKQRIEQAPEEVLSAFGTMFPGATHIEWSRQISTFTANFYHEQHEKQAQFDSTGIWLQTRTEMSIYEAPALSWQPHANSAIARLMMCTCLNNQTEPQHTIWWNTNKKRLSPPDRSTSLQMEQFYLRFNQMAIGPLNFDLSYSANVIIFREMESRAGGLVRLPGSVGARPEGQSGAGLPVPVCHRVGLRRQLC